MTSPLLFVRTRHHSAWPSSRKRGVLPAEESEHAAVYRVACVRQRRAAARLRRRRRGRRSGCRRRAHLPARRRAAASSWSAWARPPPPWPRRSRTTTTRSASPLEGVVVTRYGHAAPLRRVRCLEAAHPVPDAAGVAAGRGAAGGVDAAGADDLVLVLVSGGGSALACAPLPGLDLAAKQAVTDALLRSGAEIGEINLVRKHLSSHQGRSPRGARRARAGAGAGRLGRRRRRPGRRRLGPTVADGSGPADALAVLDRYGVDAPAARTVLERPRAGAGAGASARRPDGSTRPMPVRDAPRRLEPGQPRGRPRAVLEDAGYRTLVLSNAITGEAREAGAFHAAVAAPGLAPRPARGAAARARVGRRDDRDGARRGRPRRTQQRVRARARAGAPGRRPRRRPGGRQRRHRRLRRARRRLRHARAPARPRSRRGARRAGAHDSYAIFEATGTCS
jgi:hypothetical protein